MSVGAPAASRFSAAQQRPVPLDCHEFDKEEGGFYRSISWTSPAHLYPAPPDWHQVRHVAFTSPEEQQYGRPWSDEYRPRHQVRAAISHPVGTLPTDVPELRRSGYHWNLQQVPPASMFSHRYHPNWPKRDAVVRNGRLPRGEYYGYYHDAMCSSDLVRHRLLPFGQRIGTRDVPCMTSHAGCKSIY